MEHYVTLFDSGFLPQGLALNASLQRQAGAYTLWVLCIDEDAHRLLSALALPNVRLIRLAEVETPELLRVKPGRSRAEYCWTLTPFAPRFVFEADPQVRRVTYLDSDVWFIRPPRPIHAELERSGKGVLITEHAYAPEYDHTATSGRFCVQFVTFDRVAGEPVRQWWEQRCIEWCFARYEDGKFGDQMYLDAWPQLFGPQVHIMEHRGWALAPWNATRYPVSEAVFYHFHGLRIVNDRLVYIGAPYLTPSEVFARVHRGYLQDLQAAITTLARMNHRARSQRPISRKMELLIRLRHLLGPFVSPDRRDAIRRHISFR
jgi:hypothetical protein